MQTKLGYRFIRLSYTSNQWVSFDCDNCHKKIQKPECNACERMVNYFKVFDMYRYSIA